MEDDDEEEVVIATPSNYVVATPTNSTYDTFDEAYAALKEHGIENGYGFLCHRSKPHGSDVKTSYWYRCDRFRKYTSQATVRKTSTRTTGCPFSISIKQAGSQWKLQLLQSSHNHPRSVHPSAHNVYRKRTPAQKESIRAMRLAGSMPKQIMTALRQDEPSTFITACDVRNECNAARVEYLSGRSPIEALLDELSTPEWIFKLKNDNENRLQNLFFMHQKQKYLFRAHPDILMMDCTYRTNRFRVPLLHIVGRTNLNTTFSIGFCFLRTETIEDYYWAISSLIEKTGMSKPRVFISDQEDALIKAAKLLLPDVPQLLCVWHINKNVQTKAQQVWRASNAKTLEEKEKIKEIRATFMTRWNAVCIMCFLIVLAVLIV
jgi:hypothetical protein